MKVLENYCQQERPYGDYHGVCAVELDENETIEDVKKKYVDVERDWYETTYSNPREVSEYKQHMCNGIPEVYRGRIVLMDTTEVFCD